MSATAETIAMPTFDEAVELFGAAPLDPEVKHLVDTLLFEQVEEGTNVLWSLQDLGQVAVMMQAAGYTDVYKAMKALPNGIEREVFSDLFHRIARLGETRMLLKIIEALFNNYATRVETAGMAKN